jgi:hypothetical protein
MSQQKVNDAADATSPEAAAVAAAAAAEAARGAEAGAEAGPASPTDEVTPSASAAPRADDTHASEKTQKGAAGKDHKHKSKSKKGLTAASAGTAAAGAPMLGVPGAPQPSPLDQEYQGAAAPWAGSDLGHLSLAPLELQPDLNGRLPALPSIQVWVGRDQFSIVVPLLFAMYI